ncbi:hypothetical protein [Nitratidesulfovibrio liaohensis]|nr:hypothetical protein [Nitratidesulfovibrio liaohensis]
MESSTYDRAAPVSTPAAAALSLVAIARPVRLTRSARLACLARTA